MSVALTRVERDGNRLPSRPVASDGISVTVIAAVEDEECNLGRALPLCRALTRFWWWIPTRYIARVPPRCYRFSVGRPLSEEAQLGVDESRLVYRVVLFLDADELVDGRFVTRWILRSHQVVTPAPAIMLQWRPRYRIMILLARRPNDS